MVKVIAAFPIT